MLKKIVSVGCFMGILIIGFFFSGSHNDVASCKESTDVSSPASLVGVGSQTKCPVMGGPADPEMYVDVKGKRIYICCMACEDAIKAEPDKYIKKIEDRGETVQLLN